jgi:hypothetical protein
MSTLLQIGKMNRGIWDERGFSHDPGGAVHVHLVSEIRKSSLNQTQNDGKNHRGRYSEHQ